MTLFPEWGTPPFRSCLFHRSSLAGLPSRGAGTVANQFQGGYLGHAELAATHVRAGPLGARRGCWKLTWHCLASPGFDGLAHRPAGMLSGGGGSSLSRGSSGKVILAAHPRRVLLRTWYRHARPPQPGVNTSDTCLRAVKVSRSAQRRPPGRLRPTPTSAKYTAAMAAARVRVGTTRQAQGTSVFDVTERDIGKIR